MANLFRRRKDDHPQFYATVGEGLKKMYKTKLLPLEESYEFHEFISPPLNEPDFDAKPMTFSHQLPNLVLSSCVVGTTLTYNIIVQVGINIQVGKKPKF